MAQLVASMVVAWALGWLVPGWSTLETGVAGLILGSVGQVGDLTESALKRSVGAKEGCPKNKQHDNRCTYPPHERHLPRGEKVKLAA